MIDTHTHTPIDWRAEYEIHSRTPRNGNASESCAGNWIGLPPLVRRVSADARHSFGIRGGCLRDSTGPKQRRQRPPAALLCRTRDEDFTGRMHAYSDDSM